MHPAIKFLHRLETTHFGLFAAVLTLLLCFAIGLSVELRS